MTYEKNALGGTELMKKWVFESIDPQLTNQFEWHISGLGDIGQGRPRLLWIHDTWGSNSKGAYLKDKEVQNLFEKIIFVSQIQKESFRQAFDIPLDRCALIYNAIHPLAPHKKPEPDKVKLIYSSTPHRGLDVLLKATEILNQKRSDFELNIYSSFKIYDWPKEMDDKFLPLYQAAQEMENVNYHGTVSNEIIRQALTQTHIFAYPSTYIETSCLCLIEALSAQCLAVIPDLGALPETAAHFALMYPYQEDKNKHAHLFASNLSSAIDIIKQGQAKGLLEFQKNYFDTFYSIGRRSQQWTSFLKQTLSQYEQRQSN